MFTFAARHVDGSAVLTGDRNTKDAIARDQGRNIHGDPVAAFETTARTCRASQWRRVVEGNFFLDPGSIGDAVDCDTSF